MHPRSDFPKLQHEDGLFLGKVLHTFCMQDELEIKSSNEDHKLLRSVTRETITSDLELIDFGLQLDLPPSMVKQKLCDYPRSIETASYMVVSEWWDACGSSREEKYRVLLDAVHSMGKKCTAKKLGNIVQEKGSAYQPQTAPTFPSTGSRHLEVNNQAFIEANLLHQIGGTQLAISNAEDPVVGVSGNSFRIVEIIAEDEEQRSNSADSNIYDDGGEFLREISASLASGTRDFGLNLEAGAKPNQVDSDMFEMKCDESGGTDHNVDLEISFNGSSDQKYPLKNSDREVNSSSQGNRKEVNNIKVVIEKQTCRKKFNGEGKLSRSNTNDGYGYPDSGSFNASALFLDNHGFMPDLSVNIDLDNPDVVDHLLPEVHISNVPSHEAMSQRVNITSQEPANTKFNKENFDEGNSVCYKENKKSGEQFSVLLNNEDYTKANKNGNKVSSAEKTRETEDREYAIVDQTVVKTCQTSVANGQTGVMNGQAGVLNDQTGVLNSQTGVVNGQTGVLNGQTGVVNDQTGVVNGRTGVVNGQKGDMKGQTGGVKDQKDVANGQTDLFNDQTGLVNSQTEVMTCTTALVNADKDGC